MKLRKKIILILSTVTLLFVSCENTLADYFNEAFGFDVPILKEDILIYSVFDNTLVVDGVENTVIPDYKNYSKTPWHKEVYTSVTITNKISSIGSCAFGDEKAGNTNEITSVTLPNTIIKIGNNAFAHTKITELTIPASVEEIGKGAFSGNTELKSINFERPYSNLSIEEKAFYDCKNLEKVSVAGEFSVTSKLPEGVLSVGANAFGETKLDVVELPESLEISSMADSAFDKEIKFVLPESADAEKIAEELEKKGYKIYDESELGILSGDLTDTIKWSYYPDETDSWLVLEGIGEIPDFSSSANRPWEDYSISTIRISENITRVGSKVFDWRQGDKLSGLKDVILPSTLESIGTDAFRGNTFLAAIALPENLKRIEKYAFFDTGITSVIIPSSVENIGAYAFNPGISLYVSGTYLDSHVSIEGDSGYYQIFYEDDDVEQEDEIDLNKAGKNIDWKIENNTLILSGSGPMYDFNTWIDGNAVNAPWYGSYYSGVIIPEGITTIGAQAFIDSALLSVTIPSTVTEINDYAFYRCQQLVNLTFAENSSCKFIDIYAFHETAIESLTIPASVEEIGDGAFYVNDLINLEFESNSRCTEIAQYAFRYSRSLESVTIPASVEIIGVEAFCDCEMLSELKFEGGSKCKSIEANAFRNAAIDSVTLPSSLKTLGSNVFTQDCYVYADWKQSEAADHPYIDASNNVIFKEEDINNKFTYSKGTLTLTGSVDADFFTVNVSKFSKNDIKKIIIDSGVNKIGDESFSECTNLTQVKLASGKTAFSLTEIGVYAFNQCGSLESFEVPNSLKRIGDSAFNNCLCLQTFNFPGNIELIGDEAFYCCCSLNTVDLKDCKKLTSIGNSTFYDCTQLNQVYLSSSIKNIGSCAFSLCTGLTYIDLSANTGIKEIQGGAFSSTCLCTIDLPPYLETIGDLAFSNCCDLGSISIPSTVTYIGAQSFSECVKLNSIDFSDCPYITSIPNKAFLGCSQLVIVVLPPYLESIGDNAFLNTSLASVDIPASVKEFGVQSFNSETVLNVDWLENDPDHTEVFKDVSGYTISYRKYTFNEDSGSLSIASETTITADFVTEILSKIGKNSWDVSSLIIEDGVTTIDEGAFFDYYNMKNLTLSNSVTTIKTGAFNGTNLKKIHVPSSVTNIESEAFSDSTKLYLEWTSDKASEHTISSINSLFYYGEIDWELTDDGTLTVYGVGESVMPDYTSTSKAPWGNSSSSISKVIIAEGMTSIGTYAFYNYTKLESVTMSDSVKSIADHAFYCCKNLKEVILSSSVETIDNYAFAGTSNNNLASFKEVIIPASVVTIGQYAFQYCSGLETVTFEENSKLESLKTGVFNYCSGLGEIEIPASVNFIGQNLFSGCTSLKKVVFAEGSLVEEFNGNTFYNCTSLEEVTLPSGLTKLSTYTFQNCTSLARLDLPAGINHSDGIGAGCFSGWTSGQVIVADWNSSENKVGSNYLGSATVLYKDTVEKTVKYFVNNSEQETITTTYNYFDKNKSLYEVKNSDGKTFLGWYKEPAFNTRVTAVSELFDVATVDAVQSVNLYALWAETYTMPESQSGTATGGDGTEPEYTDMTFTETSRLKVFILSNVKAGSKYSFNFKTYTTNPLQVPYYYEHLIIDDFKGVYAASLQVQSINTLETSTVTGTAQEGMSWLLFVGAPEAEYFGENTKIGLLVKKIQ